MINWFNSREASVLIIERTESTQEGIEIIPCFLCSGVLGYYQRN